MVEIDVGRLVAGKYELVRLIGKGATGEVWLATHNSLGGEFAIKLVQPSEDEEDESAAGRFQLEAQISAKLSRKTRHIVSVSDHGEEDGLAYLVMELLEGESLESRIKRAGSLTLAETVAIVMQVARALGQAHAEGIFHRDLKPANMFLTKDEDGRLLVKLLDFGIARTAKTFRTRSPFATGKDMVLGTPSYMSPEQARGLDSLDLRCDNWALAVVAYESLTRQIPWDGETVGDVFLSICTHRMTPILSRRPDLPPAIEGVFAKSFAPKLDDRFKTAAEFSEALEELVDPVEVETATGPAPARPGESGRKLPRTGSDPSVITALPVSDSGSPGSSSGSNDGVAVGEPSVFVRRKRSSGWLLAAATALVTIGIIVFVLRSFTNGTAAEPTPPPIVKTAPVVPSPDPTPPTSTAQNVPTPTPTPASTGGPKNPARPATAVRPQPSPQPRPTPVTPPHTAAPPHTATEPRPTTTTAPTPTAPHPKDPGDVF